MKKPFFSILVPVYNVEKYLSICLDSVLSQSFSDYEIILIDDGSKDKSGSICDFYSDKYPSIVKTQHKENQGIISARRAGLKLAKGRYVCFLDSDDCLLPDALGVLARTIIETNADVILYRWKKIDNDGNEISEVVEQAFQEARYLSRNEVFEKMISTSALNSLWSKCCRYELFDVDVDYSSYYKMQYGEDFIQTLPVLAKAERFYYLDRILYGYRMNASSITHNYQRNQYRTLNVLRPLLYNYLVQLKLDSKENVQLFFQKYLNILWENIVALYRGIADKKIRKEAIEEIKQYPFVKKAAFFLEGSDIKIHRRIGLRAFYKSTNAISWYMLFYLPIMTMLRKLR